MKFIVVQNGARRGYAVPAIFEKAGMLERFYTDICADTGLGKYLAAGKCLPGIGGKLQRLGARRLPPEIRRKTRTFTAPMLRHGMRLAFGSKDGAGRFREHLRRDCDLGNAMVREGFGAATHVFSMLGEGGPFLVEAKRRGLKVVSEIYILLSTERILAEERKRFPDWEPEQSDYDAIRREFPDVNVLLTHTDFAICPSEAVRDDLADNFGISRERSIVVPYGVNPKLLELHPRPQPGRVLFVGTADLRKGIHYLAMATEKLTAKNVRCKFRVAGNVSPEIARRTECKHLNFLGRVPRECIAEEYQQADVFVLPSLAEGSAEVTYEALAVGLPVITTHDAGSVVRDGIDGRIVPERDADALAEAIGQLVEDRTLRNRMAVAARERARDYTWERYGERLVTALRALPT
ncbi:MAG: glycosyltransferase family 4 protein [Limisphaerales bacterium]